jgi:SAM-dependent methyltransferase
MTTQEIKKSIRKTYGNIALNKGGCGCGPTCGPSCGPTGNQDNTQFAKIIGYTAEDLKSIPVEANLGLSCGNPTALTTLKKGETVLDLGSGAGFDVFLASAKVGATGKVIGVDMTPEMLETARENAEKNGIKNVEFRLGEIENLPLPDNSVDIVISNCVINLSTDKERVFNEIYRVLKPGGRIAISDVALLKKLPKKIRDSTDHYVGCVSGAVLIEDYKKILEATGMKDVKITYNNLSSTASDEKKDPVALAIKEKLRDGNTLTGYVVSINIEGLKGTERENKGGEHHE